MIKLVLTNNKITFGSEANGIFIRFCSNNNISKNQVISSSGGFGIYLSNVKYANLSCNNFTNCGIKISGNSLDQWNTHKIEYTNTINTKPIYFYNDTSGVIVPNNVGEIIFVNCSDVKINNRSLIGGIHLAFTNHSVIENSTFNYTGIYLQSSNNNNLGL